MIVTRLVIRSFRIVQRTKLDTDTLDPEYLEFICELLAQAHATLSPLPVSEEGEDPVYLGLGWPEGVQEIRAEPGAQQVLGQLFMEMPEPSGTMFYLQHQGWGPVYAVLPAEQDDDDDAYEEGGAREAAVDDLLEELQSIQSDELAGKLARFDTMWEEVLSSLPAVLQFGPSDWGEHWDDFAMYVAAAILLEE